MKMKYPVVTLCGSTRFKEAFIEIQKKLTLDGYIVLSVGLFGHAGDKEVWEGLREDTVTDTKQMLDDMHKAKIDLADEIFVVNPGGYIGESTWSEICYAKMTEKQIMSLEPISEKEVEERVQKHMEQAKQLAYRQYDIWNHLCTDYADPDVLLKDMVVFKQKGYTVLNPWVPEEGIVPVKEIAAYGNGTKKYDPFAVYGTKKMARFVEEIVQRESEIEQKEWVWSEFDPVSEER